jgi:hypothetical protein
VIDGVTIVVDADGDSELVVGTQSVDARRELGVVAWSVLEVVALGGSLDNSGRWVTHTNVRDIAQRLGIGKDRAAAALVVLRGAGLVVAQVGRDRGSRFAPSCYEVRLPVSHHTDTEPPAPPAEPEVRPRVSGPVHSRPRTADHVPNLFDETA